MTRLLLTISIFLLMASCQTSPKKTDLDLLRDKIAQIISEKKATVGIAIKHNNDTLSFNGEKHCPLQSVFKFHISLVVLSEIDKGKFSLEQKITIKKEELLPKDLWSPLRDENPNGGTFTIAQLIEYSIIQSDNVACDVLIRLIGTPKTVEEYFKKNNIADIAITFNEKDMQAKWENMFQNWTTPNATNQILAMFYDNKNNLLSKNSYDFFWKTMKATTTGAKRLRGFLPKETIVAHKTGTSGTNKAGLTPATNDVGIVYLPNGQYFIISIFVTDSMESAENNEKIIADIAKAVYDHYTTSAK
ncbi:MAG: class A beta-lactamase, subclass A2 [Cytophagales bacterium]|nr:MAG: class A beta-lactamase, subclass A2 [Cytophagales bacterium]